MFVVCCNHSDDAADAVRAVEEGAPRLGNESGVHRGGFSKRGSGD